VDRNKPATRKAREAAAQITREKTYHQPDQQSTRCK